MKDFNSVASWMSVTLFDSAHCTTATLLSVASVAPYGVVAIEISRFLSGVCFCVPVEGVQTDRRAAYKQNVRLHRVARL